MLTDIEILEIFDNYRHRYADEKSSNVCSVIANFCLYINQQEEHTKIEFVSFFIREISLNTYGYQDWAIDILIKLKNQKITPIIFSIFYKTFNTSVLTKEDISKTSRMFLLLMELKDPEKHHSISYFDYVEKVIKKNLFEKHDHFYLNLIMVYLDYNENHALEILSDYYVKILSNFPILTTIYDGDIFIPCLFFIENSFSPMCKLLIITHCKNKEAGEQLYRLFIDYAKKNPCENNYQWKKCQEMLNFLKKIDLKSD
jgi:hypothetical protein